MTVPNDVKTYVKQNALSAAQLLFGPPAKTSNKGAVWTAPYRTDKHPSLEVRNDGECFDGANSVGTLIDVYARWKGMDARTEFPAVTEAMNQILRVSRSESATRPAPQTRKFTFPLTETPKTDTLQAWAAANYGLSWQTFEQQDCKVAKHQFGENGKHWAVVYPTDGEKGQGGKVRSLERLGKNGTKRIVHHMPGGAGFFPPAQVSGKGPLVVTAGEEKALALIFTGHRAVSYSCGEGAMSEKLCTYLIAQGNNEFVLAFDGDKAGREGSVKSGDRLTAAGATSVMITTMPNGKDINDLLTERGPSAVIEVISKARPKFVLPEVNSVELMKIEYPPIEWLVKGLIPEGVTMLAAPPKIGKSFFCADLACCISSGRKFLGMETFKMPTLYIDAEQSARLIQRRLRTLKWDEGATDLTFSPMPGATLDKKMLELLTPQIKGRFKLVIIDTLARLMPSSKNGDAYQRSSEMIGPFHEWATRNGINAIIIHHTKKGEGSENGESHDDITGGRGFAAVVDTLVTFKREQSNLFRVSITGRIEEASTWALKMNGAKWENLGLFDNAPISQERKEIMDTLRLHGELTPTELAEKLGKKQPAISRLLRKMCSDGLVEPIGGGSWAIVGKPAKDDSEELF